MQSTPTAESGETILVVGGSGFIGREVCRLAVEGGYEVRSISRRGRPAESDAWIDAVEWIAADVFDPDTWRNHLMGVDVLVHAVGIGRENAATGATFERLNFDAAVVVAREAERAGTGRVVFLSVALKIPFVRDAYLDAKRYAERALAVFDVESVVLRPGPVYGSDSPHAPRWVNRFMHVLDANATLGTWLGDVRPLSKTTVARATLAAAVDPEPPDLSTVREIAEYVQSRTAAPVTT